MKWTKKTIRALCGHLDTYWLQVRPLSGDIQPAKDHVRKVLQNDRARLEVVLAGVRQFEQLHARRYAEYCSTVGNEIARFSKPLEDELVQRFVRLAREEDASNKEATLLRQRLLAEGLPAEVLEYDPTERRR